MTTSTNLAWLLNEAIYQKKKVSALKKRYKQTYILTVVQLKVRNNVFYKALGRALKVHGRSKTTDFFSTSPECRYPGKRRDCEVDRIMIYLEKKRKNSAQIASWMI